MHVARPVLLALAAAALAACSSSSSAPAGSSSLPANPHGGPVAAEHDPCALFSAGQLSSAFALTFADGTAEQGALQPTCDWYDTGAGVSAVAAVKKSTEANFDSDLSGAVSKDYQRTSPVIGDDSVWFDPKSTESVSLIVIEDGYRYQVSVGVRASDSADLRRTQLMTLAKAVF
jgi:uncharacterized protein DUF3558